MYRRYQKARNKKDYAQAIKRKDGNSNVRSMTVSKGYNVKSVNDITY